MAKRSFIDINILINAEASDAPVKQQRELALLEDLYDNAQGVLSTQVLQEYCNVALKKLKLPTQQVRAQLDMYEQSEIIQVNLPSFTPAWICIKPAASTFLTPSFWPVRTRRAAACCSVKT